MLRIIIQRIEEGQKPQKIAEATILNDRTLPPLTRGNYDAHFSQRGWKKPRKTRVTQFPRKELGPWDLLFRALVTIVGWENRECVAVFASILGYRQKKLRKVSQQFRSRRSKHTVIAMVQGAGHHLLPAMREALDFELTLTKPRLWLTRAIRARIQELESEVQTDA